ncbi:MAG: polysaccharide biosynthesis/export family protein [Terriglobales bacterium]
MTRRRMGGWRAAAFALFGALALAAPAWGQAAPPQDQQQSADYPYRPPQVSTPLPLPRAETPTPMSPDLLTPAAPDNYVIGRDDLLSVFVYQMPELSAQVRVNSDGYIALPYLQKQLPASGHTAPQVRAEVQQELVAEGLARRPIARVIVSQVESRPIVVAGAVRYPEVIQAARPMRLLEVLSRAGGLGGRAGTTVLVSEQTPDGLVTQTYDVTRLLQDANPGDDPELVGGETVRVVPARLVYAVGALQRPGAFPIQPGEPVSVLKALALAEGFSSTMPANKSHAEIIRTELDGQRVEIRVNLDKILKHQRPDQVLEAGDILYVPENGRRKLVAQAAQDAAQALMVFVGYHGF